MDTRALNALARFGIGTIGQVLEMSEPELLNTPKLGRSSYRHLIRRLEELGFLPKPEEETS